MGQRENRTGPFEIPQQPKLPDLFRAALRNLQLQMRTHTVGTVVTYNPTTQRANITVDILQVIKDNTASPTPANPNPTATQPPVILKDVPVAWPRAGTGYLTFPLAPGDKGELHVQDRSLQQWLELGIATDPVSAFTHTLGDSVFHPNIHDKLNPITPPTDLTATVLDGDTFVKIGRGALLTDFLVKQQALEAAMTALLNAGVSAGTGTPGTTGTLAFTAAQTAWNTALGLVPIGTTKALGE